jgi:hypothetical protein
MKPNFHDPRDRTWQRIARALNGLQFGAVEITVHHGRIVQIERREKLRLDTPGARDSTATNDIASEDRFSGSRNTSGEPDHA